MTAAPRTNDDILQELLLLRNKFTVMRDDNARLRTEIEDLKSERDKTRSEKLKLEYALSAAMLVAEKSTDPDDISTCALVRHCIGAPPLKGTGPKLAVDNVGSGS